MGIISEPVSGSFRDPFLHNSGARFGIHFDGIASPVSVPFRDPFIGPKRGSERVPNRGPKRSPKRDAKDPPAGQLLGDPPARQTFPLPKRFSKWTQNGPRNGCKTGPGMFPVYPVLAPFRVPFRPRFGTRFSSRFGPSFGHRFAPIPGPVSAPFPVPFVVPFCVRFPKQPLGERMRGIRRLALPTNGRRRVARAGPGVRSGRRRHRPGAGIRPPAERPPRSGRARHVAHIAHGVRM